MKNLKTVLGIALFTFGTFSAMSYNGNETKDNIDDETRSEINHDKMNANDSLRIGR